jgi:hypothetical protein
MAKTTTSYTEIFLKVLAWLGIVGGVLGLFGGLVLGLMALFVPFEKLYANMPNVPPGFGEHMAKMMNFEAVLMLVTLPMNVAGAIGGVGILRRRAWGRGTLEGAAWIYLSTMIVSTVYMFGYFDYASFMPPAAAGVDPAAQAKAAEFMAVGMKVMYVVMMALWGAVVGAVLWFLRRQATRDWFGKV